MIFIVFFQAFVLAKRKRRQRIEKIESTVLLSTETPISSFTFYIQHFYLKESYFTFFSKFSFILFFIAVILFLVSTLHLHQQLLSKWKQVPQSEDFIAMFYDDESDNLRKLKNIYNY
jgi:hypothetical protein